jgi:transposase
LLSKGLQKVRVVLRSLVLLELHGNHTAAQVANNLALTAKAVRQIARRYEQGSLEQALYDKKRPGAPRILDNSQQQRIVAMACTNPPDGFARWTVRLIAQEAVKRKLVPGVGRETIRILLQSHDLKPWRGKNAVRGRTERRVPRKDGRYLGAIGKT